MTASDRPIRVLLAKVGLDGHDRGAKVVARMLRDAGMEVVYAGKLLMPDSLVETAVQEDPDVVGLSFLSGEHLLYTGEVVEGLRKRGLGRVLVLVGGCIPRQDVPALKAAGVAEVFEAGSLVGEIARFIREHVQGRAA